MRQMTMFGRFSASVEESDDGYVVSEAGLKEFLRLVEEVHEVMWKAGLTEMAAELRKKADAVLVTKVLTWEMEEKDG